MNKSKTLYILVLLALIGVALIDHMSQPLDNNQIVVGTPEIETHSSQFATLTKDNH